MSSEQEALGHNQAKFLELCNQAREFALNMKDPLLVHHHDADGCAAGAIVVSAFLAKGKKIRRICIKKLDNGFIEKLKKEGEDEVIFVDLGSGNAKINELSKTGDVIIIDHHQPLPEINVKSHVNCMLFGLDGGKELSGASTTYLVFRERVDIGVVGAVADMQAPLHGMNRYALEEGVNKGEIKIENDIVFYGRYSRPILQFLTFSDDPYIPGISFHEQRALDLLNNLKIELKNGEHWRSYADLSDDEKKRLTSAIIDILINSNMQGKASKLFGESYVFLKHGRDETYEANEFSTMLNACGRNNASEIAIGVCLGETDALEKARELLRMHRQNIRNGIEYASSNVQDFGKFFFLDGRGIIDEGIIGIICGMHLQQHYKKPIIGISDGEDNTIKASSRATKAQIAGGLNLGAIMKKAADACGGIGGGHRIAAGASIPKEKINEFLVAVGKEIP